MVGSWFVLLVVDGIVLVDLSYVVDHILLLNRSIFERTCNVLQTQYLSST